MGGQGPSWAVLPGSNRVCVLILVISKCVTNINVTPYEIHILWMLCIGFFCTFLLSDCMIVHFGPYVKWKI